MDYLDFFIAAAVAVAVGSLIFLGFALVKKSDFTTLDADMVALAVAATYVSIMVALRPGFYF